MRDEWHGVPAEGVSDNAVALFRFPSLAAYEQYRRLFGGDPAFVAAVRIRGQSGCVLRHQRTFRRPLLPGAPSQRRPQLATDAPAIVKC
jgi:hypothetical protein